MHDCFSSPWDPVKEEEKRQKEIFLPRAVHEWVEIVFIVEREQLGYAKINKENGTLNIFLFRKISRSLRKKELIRGCGEEGRSVRNVSCIHSEIANNKFTFIASRKRKNFFLSLFSSFFEKENDHFRIKKKEGKTN